VGQLHIPDELRDLLRGSPFESPVYQLSGVAGDVLADNAMPFFPGFTAHGAGHVESVLRAAVALIPPDVREGDFLRAPDAAALVCATVLHDLGMHLRERGFVDLVTPESSFGPISFFDCQQGARAADEPWSDLWKAFQHEARHFGPSQLDVILGPANAGVPEVAFASELQPEALTLPDRLLIGEFLRRHHARLSHEIALNGFPGADDEFPAAAEIMPSIGDLSGAIARSHNEDLRLMRAYLEDLEPGNHRPKGVLALYLMGLLRIADFLQIEADRAPPVLLRLKAPQSRVSIEEWGKHGAVVSVSWDHDDPYAIAVSVASNHALRTHLALKELLDRLQEELDRTSAVLREAYSSTPMRALRLYRQRVVSNIDQPSLHRTLPYLPRRAALQSDPDLFRLMIRDLYSREFYVAGRELVQNAADAVRARRRWERSHGRIPEDDLPEIDTDIVVTIETESDPEQLVLSVWDRGIGMLPDTIVNYYLRAGASFGPVASEFEGMDPVDAVGAMKAGRFGIGAFAGFLLGPEVRVTTRHADSPRAVRFRALIDAEIVEIEWTSAPVGTRVEIPFLASTLKPATTPDFLLEAIAGTYRLQDPPAIFRGPAGQVVEAPADIPSPGQAGLPRGWFEVATERIEGAYWRLPSGLRRGDEEESRPIPGWLSNGDFVHNGILVERAIQEMPVGGYDWSDWRLPLHKPAVAAFDPRHTVGLALHRFELIDEALPFESELLGSIGLDLLAHALVCGPQLHPLIAYELFGAGTGPASSIHARHGFVPPISSLVPRADWEFQLLGLTGLRDPRLPSLEGFLNADSEIPWTPLTFRGLGGPLSSSPWPAEEPVRTTLQGELARVLAAGLELGHSTGARQACTVVVASDVPSEAWDGQTEGTVRRDLPVWSSDGHWQHIGPVRKQQGTHIFFVGQEGTAPRDDVIEAAQELARDIGQQWTCLTLLTDFEPNETAQSVAREWPTCIDDLIPTDVESREALAAAIEREHPAVKPHLAYWRTASSSADDP
jgi:hypothetical protein